MVFIVDEDCPKKRWVEERKEESSFEFLMEVISNKIGSSPSLGGGGGGGDGISHIFLEQGFLREKKKQKTKKPCYKQEERKTSAKKN